jgi:hypothetical protein
VWSDIYFVELYVIPSISERVFKSELTVKLFDDHLTTVLIYIFLNNWLFPYSTRNRAQLPMASESTCSPAQTRAMLKESPLLRRVTKKGCTVLNDYKTRQQVNNHIVFVNVVVIIFSLLFFHIITSRSKQVKTCKQNCTFPLKEPTFQEVELNKINC